MENFNIYKCINEITEEIEEQLYGEIDYEMLARKMGVNVYTMKKIFSLLTGIPLNEYIRNRRLTIAGVDIFENGTKVVDAAFKYGYDNATSFARAFEHFHKIKPSQVTKISKLKNYPRIIMDERHKSTEASSYEIITLDELVLYGISQKANNELIKKIAPELYRKVDMKYRDEVGEIEYGMILYSDTERENTESYSVLYTKKAPGLECVRIPSSKWLKFEVSTQEAKDIQRTSDKFYYEFLPSCKFNLRELPELEHYHDGKTDFLVAIY